MEHSGPRFNRGALVGVPVMLIVLAGLLYQDRLPQVPTWALIAGWLVLAGAVVWVVLLLDSRRTTSLRRVASDLGFTFSAGGHDDSLSAFVNPDKVEAENSQLDAVLDGLGPQPPQVMAMLRAKMADAKRPRGLERTELCRLGLFRGVDHRSASNVMAGALAGGSAAVFDYTYHPKSGLDPGHSSSVTQTVAAFRFPGLALPAFEVSPAGVLKRIGAALGIQDLDFESHPAFSSRFHLRADDENAVRALVQPEVLSFFESLERTFNQTVEGTGECVVVYRPGKTVDPAAARAFVTEATAVASVFHTRRR